MPFSLLHRKSKTRSAVRKHREDSLKLCPCSLCLNCVQLKESDVDEHIARFGLQDNTLSCEDIEEPEIQEIISIRSSFSVDPEEMFQTVEPPLKKPPKILSADESSSTNSGLSWMESPTEDFAFAFKKPDDEILPSNSSVSSADKSESTDGDVPFMIQPLPADDAENVREVPDYLQQLTDEELYRKDKANLPLFEGSAVNVLQALAGYLLWFMEHPGTSKSGLSDLLRLHHDEILPPGNNLPSLYDEAISFIKPFLLPFVVYHACPNDCGLFSKTNRYDYSHLKRCPVCNEARFISKGKPFRRFYYYPLKP